MFSRLIDRLRPRIDLGHRFRSAEELGNKVSDLMQQRLPPDFQRIGNMLWIGQPADFIRPIFKFQTMKGMAYSACWGVSMDFVPLLVGQSLRWKKTAKTARFDLCSDPVDPEGVVPSWCSFSTTDSDRKLEQTVEATAKAACRDWSELRSLVEIATAFEKRSRMRFSRFSLDNYAQTNLAWGLVLLAIGDVDQGEARLNRFTRDFKIMPDASILKTAKSEASAIAGR